MIKKLNLAPAELERFYALVRAANEYGLPGDLFTPLVSPLACAVRSIPVADHPDDAFGDGLHTEALMGCIMGALHQITGTLESNRWTDLRYRFLGMCSPEGEHDAHDDLDTFIFTYKHKFAGPSEKMTSFSFEPDVWLYEVGPGHTLAMCKLYAESYSCLLVFEVKS